MERVASEGGELALGDLLDRFSERAFGLFLLVALVPAFLPLPAGAGAISGPLVVLVGVQLLLQAEHPWMPRWLQRRPVSPASIERFRRRLATPLAWLDRVCRPRWAGMIDHAAAHVVTGLLLIALGILLSLPIPLTNYPFGLILMVFAVALIERDGRAMLLAWGLGFAEVVVAVLFFEEASEAVMALWQRLAQAF